MTLIAAHLSPTGIPDILLPPDCQTVLVPFFQGERKVTYAVSDVFTNEESVFKMFKRANQR